MTLQERLRKIGNFHIYHIHPDVDSVYYGYEYICAIPHYGNKDYRILFGRNWGSIFVTDEDGNIHPVRHRSLASLINILYKKDLIKHEDFRQLSREYYNFRAK